VILGFELTASPLVGSCSTTWVTLLALFCVLFCFVFEIWSWESGLSLTVILLISASWVARITGVSHQHLALIITFQKYYYPILFYGRKNSKNFLTFSSGLFHDSFSFECRLLLTYTFIMVFILILCLFLTIWSSLVIHQFLRVRYKSVEAPCMLTEFN
jgi:hypothetical protein